jgi:hypothetical protein
MVRLKAGEANAQEAIDASKQRPEKPAMAEVRRREMAAKVRAADDQIVMRVDPIADDELLEQGSIEEPILHPSVVMVGRSQEDRQMGLYAQTWLPFSCGPVPEK